MLVHVVDFWEGGYSRLVILVGFSHNSHKDDEPKPDCLVYNYVQLERERENSV